MKKKLTARAKVLLVSGFLVSSLGLTLHLAGERLEQSQSASAQKSDMQIDSLHEFKESVVVFFWYGCPHCYRLEDQFRKDGFKSMVLNHDYNLIKIPVALNPTWELHARLFYALENAGAIDDDHFEIMTILQSHLPTSDSEIISILEMAVKNSNSPRSIFNSNFSAAGILQEMTSSIVDEQILKSQSLAKKVKIQGVPQVMIDGHDMIKLGGRVSYGSVQGLVEKIIFKTINNE